MRALILMPLFAATACLDMGRSTVDVKVMKDTPYLADAIDPAANPDNPMPAMACDYGYSYEGFGGTRLEAGRADEDPGFDRDRVKPYSALQGEYARVLGSTPVLLSSLGSTFGAVAPRWFIEPESNAVSLYSSMRVAFVGCLALTNTEAFDAMPDATNAADQCASFARRFWSRSPDTDELAACVTVATAATAAEPVSRRKWAYACASVLSSAPFLTF